MSPVHVVKPPSFDVIDFLNAYSTANGKFFKVTDPESGRVIEDEVLNLGILDIVIKLPEERKPSPFLLNTDPSETHARLNLTPIPAGTLLGIAGDAWEMIVDDADEIQRFVPIADALSKEFGFELVLNPYSKNDDPDHLEPVPVNPLFPDGPKICKILPRS